MKTRPRTDIDIARAADIDIDSKGCNAWKLDMTRCTSSSPNSLGRTDKGAGGWTDGTGLWGDGLGLDSLEAAELSAMLEDEFGSDPFSAGGDLPEKVGDIVAFYAAADRMIGLLEAAAAEAPDRVAVVTPEGAARTPSCSTTPNGWQPGSTPRSHPIRHRRTGCRHDPPAARRGRPGRGRAVPVPARHRRRRVHRPHRRARARRGGQPSRRPRGGSLEVVPPRTLAGTPTPTPTPTRLATPTTAPSPS